MFNLIFFLNDENIFTQIFYIKKKSKFELNFKNQVLNTHFKINIEKGTHVHSGNNNRQNILSEIPILSVNTCLLVTMLMKSNVSFMTIFSNMLNTDVQISIPPNF